MARYLTMVEDRLKRLDEWIIRRIPQMENLKANALAGIAATLPIREVVMLPVYLQATSSITPRLACSDTEVDLSRMHDIVEYLQIGELLEDEKHEHKVHIQAAYFTLINDRLYKRSFGGLYLRCLSDLEAKYVIAELHEGVSDNHPGGWTLTHRAHTQGYY